jgi:hypothetical protein
LGCERQAVNNRVELLHRIGARTKTSWSEFSARVLLSASSVIARGMNNLPVASQTESLEFSALAPANSAMQISPLKNKALHHGVHGRLSLKVPLGERNTQKKSRRPLRAALLFVLHQKQLGFLCV